MNTDKTEEFEVCTFDSDDATAECHEGGLTFEKALEMANELWNDGNGEYYGVEVISQDANVIDPIKWIRCKAGN
jgi:hypothetical protein